MDYHVGKTKQAMILMIHYTVEMSQKAPCETAIRVHTRQHPGKPLSTRNSCDHGTNLNKYPRFKLRFPSPTTTTQDATQRIKSSCFHHRTPNQRRGMSRLGWCPCTLCRTPPLTPTHPPHTPVSTQPPMPPISAGISRIQWCRTPRMALSPPPRSTNSEASSPPLRVGS